MVEDHCEKAAMGKVQGIKLSGQNAARHDENDLSTNPYLLR